MWGTLINYTATRVHIADYLQNWQLLNVSQAKVRNYDGNISVLFYEKPYGTHSNWILIFISSIYIHFFLSLRDFIFKSINISKETHKFTSTTKRLLKHYCSMGHIMAKKQCLLNSSISFDIKIIFLQLNQNVSVVHCSRKKLFCLHTWYKQYQGNRYDINNNFFKSSEK